ncbi:unnamed protein product [Arctia plantaginis]|uniref:Uncharacterized protein n=1 Tax=Arctia plantaginis TaxID=874455 RepID=A0A8S0ZLH6_ARCPL|nr:unnamed protein product [Arctia plantaginis]
MDTEETNKVKGQNKQTTKQASQKDNETVGKKEKKKSGGVDSASTEGEVVSRTPISVGLPVVVCSRLTAGSLRTSERLRSRSAASSDGGSSVSTDALDAMDVEFRDTGSRKRGRSGEEGVDPSQDMLPPKVAGSQRGRSRTPIARSRAPVPVPSGSAFSGAESYRRVRADGEAAAEEEIADLLLKIREPVEGDAPRAPVSVQERARAAVAIIQKVATKSVNLKGSFVRALKDSSSAMSEVVEGLVGDVSRLQMANDRLTEQVNGLSAQFARFRANLPEREAPSTPQPVPTATSGVPDAQLRSILDAVGRMLDGRLAGLEARLPPAPVVRPPLASSQRPGAAAPTALPVVGGRVSYAAAASAPTPPAPQGPRKGAKAPARAPAKAPAQAPAKAPAQAPAKAPAQAPAKAPAQTKAAKRSGVAFPPLPAPTSLPGPSAPAPSNEGWQEARGSKNRPKPRL